MGKFKNHITPPRLAEKLLTWFIKDDLAEEVLGDLDEKFYSTAEKHSIQKAKRNYWFQVIQYMRPFAFKFFKNNNSFNNTTMVKHYIKISWRNLLRDKVFSAIKIGGFALGIAACILIFLYVNHELSYDKHYKKGNQIFRLANNYQGQDYSELWTNLQGPFKPVLEETMPEIDLISRVVLWKWGNVGENHVRPTSSRNNIYESGFIYSDTELFSILEIPMIYGSQKDALSTPNSIVISKTKSDKYFPNENPVGKQLVLNDDTENAYTIGGVMEDFPANSHLQADFIMTLFGRTSGPGSTGWCCANYNFYVKLIKDADKYALEQKMVEIRDTYVIDQLKAEGETGLEDIQKYQSYYLQPVQEIYLNEKNIEDHQSHGSAQMVWIFGAVAVTILLLACLNFINLSTAKSIKRAKEVGIRKVVGSQRKSIIFQYLSESSFYSVLAVLLGILIASMALPLFNEVSAKSLSIPWATWWFIPLLLAGALVIGFLSGIYPAFFLSSFNPLAVLKGKISGGRGTSTFRSSMVVFQFTVTVILIISALVTQSQFQHFMNKPLGFEKDQVVNLLGLNSLKENEKEIFKEELLKLPSIASATLGDYLPVSGGNTTNYAFQLQAKKGLNEGFEAARWIVDEDYLQTMGMELVDGRNFNDNTSDEQSIVINESMMRLFGIDQPIGTPIVDMFDQSYRIIGVVKNFHFQSLAVGIRPLAMVRGNGNSTLSVKILPTNIEETLAGINTVWEGFKPNQPIRYSFMDQRFEQMYEALIKAKKLFLVFSVLSILIACLGLFALSAYSVEQRIKEVSVRKILGASATQIFSLLATDFIKLIGVSILIAIPLGWYLMDSLLADTVNRIDLSWPIFIVAGFIAFFIALATVSFESIKAAYVNPASKLRSE
ncbi:MAG: putative ABC transport system permease protein [Roseivirga sp.]